MGEINPPCKHCGGTNTEFVKSWPVLLRVQKAGPKGTGKIGDPKRSNKAIISLYACRDCHKTFRVGSKKS